MQTPEHNQPQEDVALQAPPGLVSALQQLSGEPGFIPPTVDEAILRAAQRHLSKPEQRRSRWLRFMPWVAATAALVLLLAVIPRFYNKPALVSTRSAAAAREDFNHDGHVDILDAFALAHKLKSGTTPSLQLDLNDDGLVDERDVAALAARAVKLEKGGHS